MQLILAMSGSLGDHLPILHIAREAARRGHRVVALGCEKFLGNLDETGIVVRPTSSAAEYEQFCHSVAHDRPRDQLKLFRSIAARDLVRVYDAIRELGSLSDSAIMVPKFPLGIGGRIISEQFQIPLAEFQFDPLPMFAGNMGWERRAILWFHDLFVNRVFGPDVNAFRKKLGLTPLHNFCGWAEERLDLICGLYPEWIGRARRFHEDRRFLFAGFAGLKGFQGETLPAAVEEFLANGPAPVLISQPSWSNQKADFLRETEAALKASGARGIVTGVNSPASATSTLLQLSFLPHRQVLSRVAAFVHHGGAGTAGTSLAAGVPQLIVPQLPMQRDFGVRLERLGVGRNISPRAYRARRVAPLLAELLNSPAVRERCRELAARLQHDGADGVGIACDAMEALVRGERVPFVRADDCTSASLTDASRSEILCKC